MLTQLHLGAAARVSLVVATVDRVTELVALVDSLAKQSCRNFELVIVDQNTDDRLAPVVARAQILGIEVRRLRLDQRNVSLARNIGLDAARYTIVGFPDDDCWYEPEVIDGVIAAFADSGQLDGLVARWVERDGAQRGPSLLSAADIWRLQEVPSSSSLFFRRSLHTEVGAFDVELGAGRWYGSGEEIDLMLRCLDAGARVAYSPEIRIHHRIAPTNQGSYATARRHARGTGALHAKHHLHWRSVARGALALLLEGVMRWYRPRFCAGKIGTALGCVEGYVAWRATALRRARAGSPAPRGNPDTP